MKYLEGFQSNEAALSVRDRLTDTQLQSQTDRRTDRQMGKTMSLPEGDWAWGGGAWGRHNNVLHETKRITMLSKSNNCSCL